MKNFKCYFYTKNFRSALIFHLEYVTIGYLRVNWLRDRYKTLDGKYHKKVERDWGLYKGTYTSSDQKHKNYAILIHMGRLNVEVNRVLY